MTSVIFSRQNTENTTEEVQFRTELGPIWRLVRSIWRTKSTRRNVSVHVFCVFFAVVLLVLQNEPPLPGPTPAGLTGTVCLSRCCPFPALFCICSCMTSGFKKRVVRSGERPCTRCETCFFGHATQFVACLYLEEPRFV